MPDFDILIFGATGFTGRQAARYLAQHAPKDLRWAVAGRNERRVSEVARESGAHGQVVADSTDKSSIDAMVEKTRVLLTTAGPYSRYGTPVVDACVKHGVDYVDITGETPWVADLIEQYHDRAAEAGTRIVPFCGCDSVPADLGALIVADYFGQKGLSTRRVSGSYKMSGGLNGGTLATALHIAETGRRRDLANWFLLNPAGYRSGAPKEESRDLATVKWDADRSRWLMPFVMAPINTRVVRRSNGLFAQYDEPYGKNFVYQEAMETKKKLQAYAAAGILGGVDGLLKKSWGRKILSRVGPDPGQGPSEATMDGGFLTVTFVGEADSGEKVLVRTHSQGDPGNRYTVMALCESALLLATQRDDLPGGLSRGGILTPATALGLPLLERLKRAGLEVDIQSL